MNVLPGLCGSNLRLISIHTWPCFSPDDVDQAQRSKAEIKTAKGEREMRMGRDDKKSGILTMKREIPITYKLDEAPYEKGTIIKEMGSHPSFQGNFFQLQNCYGNLA